MRRTVVITLLCLAGCRDRLTDTPGGLWLPSPRLDLPHAYVGQTRRASSELLNTARSARTVKLSLPDAPFALELQAADLEVPGASGVQLPFSFAPTRAGHFEHTVQLEGDDGTRLSLLLVGNAEPPPQCASPTPCRTSAFDLDTSACQEAPANEGLDCTGSNACYAAAVCVAGQCVGSARDCDDQDACSTDLCDPTRGCVHFPNTARCPAPPDPCHISLCDPKVGCTFADAPDGTRCGPSDCSMARVCMLGQCRAVPVGEGALCGDESPCQPRGRCTQGSCVRPPKRTLNAAWTVLAPEGEVVDWDSIADSSGNVYWRERRPEQPVSTLISVTTGGVQRWRRPVSLPVQLALVDGVLVVRRREGVEARRPHDGQVLWSRDFSTPNALASTKAYSRGLGGSLYLGYARSDAGVLLGSTITSLNVFSGATLWQVQLPGQSVEEQTMPADENGYLYVGTWDQMLLQRRYLGFTPGGQQRWSIVNPHASPAAVFGGRVYHWDHWLSETTDGTWVNEREPELRVSGYPRLALGAISYVGTETVDAGHCAMPATAVPSLVMKLVRVDPPTSRQTWALEIAGPFSGGGLGLTNPVLTSRSTVVFSQSVDYCDQTGQFVLREVSASGEASWSCPLPGHESYFGEALLSEGKYITAIRSRDGGRDGVRAIELPGFELPEHGWATAWGSSSRDNHAR